jgi:hypothetical protein
MQTFLQGKLKKTLHEKCPTCNINLQLRVLSTRVVSATRFFDEEIIVCPRCGEKSSVKPIKKRSKGGLEEE